MSRLQRPFPHALFALPVLALMLLVACRQATPPDAGAGPSTSAATTETWRTDVETIAAAADNAARLAAIAARLQTLGLPAARVAFTRDDRTGSNLLAPVAGAADAPLLLLGAHADRVEMGQGATDNASGVAVVLELARRLQARPLAHHRVGLAFWDLEEAGLLGSRAYVAEGGERPALYVNFDVFGWGDTLWMMTPDPAQALVAASRAATHARALGFSAGDQYPPTDHRAFLEAGWPAVSYSLVGGDEIPLILAMFAGETPAQPPRVMRVIHSPDDSVDQTDPAAAARGIDAVEDALRRWDAGMMQAD